MGDDPEAMGLCSCAMIGRGALIKPWLPMEIKESRHIDMSASDRLDMLKKFWFAIYISSTITISFPQQP
jgi:tRNA-dihydrouridine synthase 3